MKFFDSHLHYVDDAEEMAKIANESKYKDVFIGYAFSMAHVDYESHLKQSCGCILMPACLKETNIQQANESLRDWFSRHSSKKTFCVPFIEEELSCIEFPKFVGYKEHFYIHNCFEWARRERAYHYLDAHHKLLINRIDYVKFLRDRYPNMIIQIAHLGCFQNSVSASLLVLDELTKLPNVYFDGSAVFNEKLLAYALKIAPNRILFGTDMPYIGEEKVIDRYEPVVEACIDSIKKKFLYENACEMIEKTGRI